MRAQCLIHKHLFFSLSLQDTSGGSIEISLTEPKEGECVVAQKSRTGPFTVWSCTKCDNEFVTDANVCPFVMCGAQSDGITPLALCSTVKIAGLTLRLTPNNLVCLESGKGLLGCKVIKSLGSLFGLA